MRGMLGSLVVGALAIGLAACETREAADGAATNAGGADTLTGTGADTTVGTGTSRMTDTAGRAETGARIDAELEALNDSGISGSVRLTPGAAGTVVMLTVQPSDSMATGGRRHVAHIHRGSCDNIGAVVAPLEAVATDAPGGATSTSRVDLDLATLTDGNHIVVVHAAGGEPGRPVACAPIQAPAASDTTQISI